MEKLYSIFLQYPRIVTDTRSPLPDSIFFALRGPNFNANEYAEKALEAGSKYAIIDDANFKKDERFILVDDVLKTLQDLANYHRKHFKIPFIGLTGSNGKTTTKELVNAVLSEKFKVACTQGNFNNHIGVPLTLLSVNSSHEIALIEMGANKPGDIKELSDIADPDFGLITNIGKAHLEGFGSYENVIKTKTELYHHIRFKQGKIFINSDNEILLKNASDIPTITYGIKTGETKGSEIKVNPFLSLRIQNTEGNFDVSTHLIGSYNAENIIAAASIGKQFGLSNEQIKTGLENYKPTNNRSQVEKRENYTLIMDAYNANPSSIKAAIENFHAIEHSSKFFILGDMFELGESSDEEHQNVIQQAKEKKLNGVFIGKYFSKFKTEPYHFFETTEEAKPSIKNIIPQKSLILIKGSRGMRLENLLDMF